MNVLKEIARFLTNFSGVELFVSLALAILLTFLSTICYSSTTILSEEKAIVYFGFPSPSLKIELKRKLAPIFFRWGVMEALTVEGHVELLFEGAFLDILFYMIFSFLFARVIYHIRDEYHYRKYYSK